MAKTPGQLLRVFVSSTFLDNRERREIVQDAILQADMLPVGMERFTAGTDPVVAECEAAARDCDIYLGLVAWRYGWVPPGAKISITEMEYNAAAKAGRPRLMFELSDTVPQKPATDFDQGPDRWKKQDLLEQFRQRFRADQTPCGRFWMGSPDDEPGVSETKARGTRCPWRRSIWAARL